MARFRYQHIKSSVEGKAPTAAQIKVAEIGVNDFAGDEKLFIKNSAGEVVDFPRGYSQTVIDENERVTAEALNYLNTNKLDASAYTPTDLSNYYTKDETSGATEIQGALDEKLNINDFDTYSGAVDTVLNGKADTATTLAGYGITDAYTKDEIDSTERTIAESLNDLNTRKLDATAYTPTDLSDYYTKSEVDVRDLWVSGTGLNSAALKGGNNTASGNYSVAEGSGTTASSNFSHSEGQGVSARGLASHAEGAGTIASGDSSHAEGAGTQAIGAQSHAEGAGSKAVSSYSHAEGMGTNASGSCSHSEGQNTNAYGNYSHSEGGGTNAYANYSHSEGGGTTASGECSHSEGAGSRAIGVQSHAEGGGTTASGTCAHSEGGGTQAIGSNSHAEGAGSQAIGDASHAEGGGTIANNQFEHASGRFNVSSSGSSTFGDSGNTLFSVGNGSGTSARHNAFEIRQNGDIYFTSGNTDVKLQDSIPAVDGYADSVKYNSTTHYVEFYHGTTAGTKVFEYDASPFLIDGMVEDVEIEDVEISGETVTCLVISFNTAAGKQDINIPLSDIFDPSNYYTKADIDDMEYVISQSLNDLNTRKLDASAYTPTDLSNYYTKSETSGATEIQNALDGKSDTGHTHDDRYYTEIEIDNLLAGKVSTSDIDQVIDATTSASTGAVSTSAVYGFVTSYTPSITVDQVLDDTTSASTNPVSSKAVYDVIVDNEYVWANAYATMSGAISSHTVDTDIHVTSADKTAWNAKLDATAYTPTDLSNYYTKSETSGATEISTALADKADTATTYTKTEVDERDLWVSGTGTNSVAQKGGNNTASGLYSHAEGRYTKASGDSSHSEGWTTTAGGEYSHAEGNNTIASGDSSHAEGRWTKANGGHGSHAEGYYAIASGTSSHAEGQWTRANGDYSHAEGYTTIANNQSEHASGQYNVSSKASSTFGDSGNTLFSVGNGTADNAKHNAFEIRQNGDIYITSGNSDVKLQDYLVGGSASVELWVSGTGTNSVAQKGGDNVASGNYSIAEGQGTVANGNRSHAEGYNTSATTNGSHAEGVRTLASGPISHAEGQDTVADGSNSHAEGLLTAASGYASHAEGFYTRAFGQYSHAEGDSAKASGYSSHAEGANTIANNTAEHASGQYNVSSSSSETFGHSGNTLFSVGNGTNDARHNAFEIRQNGDIYITSGNSDIKLQDYIGSVETVTAITPLNSGSTEPIATKVVAENELVMANALNDLESRKLDASAYTTTSAVTSGSTVAIESGGVYAQMDGLKLKKITQSDYDQLQTKDPNTLYVITD